MDDDAFYDPLARRCEQAKAWTAGSLAVLLGSFVIGVHVVVGLALIGVILGAGRWIQLSNRLRERERALEHDADEPEPADGPDALANAAPNQPSNIIQFPRQP